MKCDYCLNSRPVVSENGTHCACCLTSQQLKKCLIGEKDYFEPRPSISKIFLADFEEGEE
jgi:hypothetical protein